MKNKKYYIPVDFETGMKKEVSRKIWEDWRKQWDLVLPRRYSASGKPIILGTGGELGHFSILENLNKIYKDGK